MEAQAAWVRLHSSLVDPDSMPQASQWSSKFVTLAGQAGQGNASLTEILIGRYRVYLPIQGLSADNRLISVSVSVNIGIG